MDKSKMRYRVKLHTVRTDETKFVYVNRDDSGQVINAVTYGGPYEKSMIKEHMWDVKTPKFHKLSREGRIVNSPMLKETIVIDRSASAASDISILPNKFSSVGTGTVVPDLPQAFRLSTPQTSIDVAVTAAYAGVTANEENALLWAGEFKEAMTMFYSMGLRLIRLVNSTAKQRKDYAKGLLSVKEAQSMTLALLYGLLPLQDSVEQWRKGLLRHKKEGRNTSRGYNRFSDSLSYRYNVGNLSTDWFVDVEERIETNIRAGVLYDVTLPDYPIFTHIDIKNIVSTAYALSRLSFVWDWFINVGNTLAAWSPAMGTRELSAWVTIEEKFSMTARTSWVSKSDPLEVNRSCTFNGVATQSLTRKSRVPVDRSDLDLLPNFNLNLNLDKIFALVLLFAKVKDKP